MAAEPRVDLRAEGHDGAVQVHPRRSQTKLVAQAARARRSSQHSQLAEPSAVSARAAAGRRMRMRALDAPPPSLTHARRASRRPQDELPPGWAASASGTAFSGSGAGGASAAHASGAQQPIVIGDSSDSDDGGGSSGDEDADVPLAARIAALTPAPADAPRKRTGGELPGINAEEVQLDIVCGGVVAKLIMPPRFKRNQVRVLYAGAIITPSQFEASCGRVRTATHHSWVSRIIANCADTSFPCQDVRKKWRSTLRVLCADGSDGVSVGKWMAEHVEVGAIASPPPAPPAPPPAPAPAAKSPAAEAAERLQAQVEALLGDDGVLLAEQAPAFVQLLAGAEAAPSRVYTTRVLEHTVQHSPPGAPVLAALVASEALTPLEAFVEAAAAEKDAEQLLRTLRLLEALPVTLAALQRCGLGKRCNKLQKFSALPGLAGAHAAPEVDKAAARLVAKWKAQVNAETAAAPVAAAPPAAKKPRVTSPTAASAAAAQKAARALADDDMFTGPGKAPPKAPPPLSRPTVRLNVVSDAEARALAARAAAPAAGASISPRLGLGGAPSGVAAMPAMERLARERAAREAAAAAQKAQRAAECTVAESKAAVDAQVLFQDLYPNGVVDVPEVVSAPPPKGPLTSNIPSMHAPPAPPAPRDRKRKRKAVVWAPEATLLQIRLFKKDEPLAGESVAFPDPATMGLGAAGGDVDMADMPSHFAERVAQRDAAAERRSADSWRQRTPDPAYVATPLMTAVHAWWCPPAAWLPPLQPGENAPARGEASTERQTQREREAARPPVLYPTLASVPDHPSQGPARAERPVDNSKAPVINAGDPAPPAPPMQQHFMQAPPPQQQQPMMMQQQPQPGYGMPMQQQQPQGATALQQQLYNSMLGLPQQQQMSAPPQQQVPPQMAWMGQQPMHMQQPMQPMQQPMQQMLQQPQMQPQMQAPPQQNYGWLQQQQPQAPPPQQQMPAVGGLLQEWIAKSAAAAPAPQPAAPPIAAADPLADLVRSLTAAGGFNASALQQALLQVGSAPIHAQGVPGPRPPPGPPPAAAHAPAMIGQWPQAMQQLQAQPSWEQQQMGYSVPPPQPPSGPPPPSAFASTQPLPQPSFFDRTPLPNTAPPPQQGGGYKRGPCAFFNTPRGCRNGDGCKVRRARHVKRASCRD
jgi:hypothetical protein